MTWKAENPQGNEAAKTRWRAVPYTRGDGLDLGCGGEKFMATNHVVGVDSGRDVQLFGNAVNAQMCMDVTDLSKFAAGSWDFVFSSHVLEHIEYAKVPGTLREWFRVVRIGGHVVMYLPDEDQYPKCAESERMIFAEPHVNQDHKWNVNYDRVVSAAVKTGFNWDLVHYEVCGQDDEYSLFFAFKKLK